MPEQKIKANDNFFSKKRLKAGVMKRFFESYLPSELKESADLHTLQQCNTKWFRDILGEGIADLLFTIKFVDKDGYVAVFLEYKASSDEYMALCIKKYMLKIFEEHLKKKPDSDLPLIHPIIFRADQNKHNTVISIKDAINKKLKKLVN